MSAKPQAAHTSRRPHSSMRQDNAAGTPKIRLCVRLALLALLIALAVFLYFYGKQRTLYVDNWSCEINGESYRPCEWALVRVDDLDEQEYSPRQRRGIPLRGRTHTIYITTEDDDFNEITLEPVEFTLPADRVIISIPALIAGVAPSDAVWEFVPESSPVQTEQTTEGSASEEGALPGGDEFGDMTIDF